MDWKSVLVASLTACWSSASLASLPFMEQHTCPYDGTKFTFDGQGSGTVFDRSLDFMPFGALTSPWPIAVCPTNGVVMYKPDFTDAELEKLRPFVFSDAYRSLKEETTYYRAARLMEQAGESADKVSWFLLQATWQAAQDSARYERYATELVARLPADIAVLEGEQKRVYQMVQGELLRRLGRFDESKRHFEALLADAGLNADESAIARFQLQLVEAGDRSEHRMSEVLKAR